MKKEEKRKERRKKEEGGGRRNIRKMDVRYKKEILPDFQYVDQLLWLKQGEEGEERMQEEGRRRGKVKQLNERKVYKDNNIKT